MKTLTAAATAVWKRKHGRKETYTVEYKRRYWNGSAYVYEAAWTVLTPSEAPAPGPISWKLDTTTQNTILASNVTINLDNSDGRWLATAYQPSVFAADNVATSGYEPYMTKFRIQFGYVLDDGTTELVSLFVGYLKDFSLRGGRSTISYTLMGSEILLENADAQNVSDAFTLENLSPATGDGTNVEFLTTSVGVWQISDVQQNAASKTQGTDYTLSQLDENGPAKITMEVAPTAGHTMKASGKKWKANQAIETLIGLLCDEAGIGSGVRTINPVVIPGSTAGSKTITTRADFEAGTVLAGIDTTTVPGEISIAAGTSFSYTGSEASYVVPAGVTFIAIDLKGPGGGGGGGGGSANPGAETPQPGTAGATGGSGDKLTGTLAVTPGETLTILVGAGGGGGVGGTAGTNSGGGGGGGGGGLSSGTAGSAGGGASPGSGGAGGAAATYSYIKRGATVLAQALLSSGAAGGAGGTWGESGPGGDGGAGAGAGTNVNTGLTLTAGGGGAGGAGGAGGTDGTGQGGTGSAGANGSLSIVVMTAAFESAAQNILSVPTAWGTLDKGETLNGGTVTYATAASTDGVSWDAYVDISAGIIQSALKQYFKVRATITRASSSATSPAVDSLVANFMVSGINLTIAIFKGKTCLQAITDLARIADYEWGFDGDGNFFFRSKTVSGAAVFEFDQDTALLELSQYRPGWDRVINVGQVKYGDDSQYYAEYNSTSASEASPTSQERFSARIKSESMPYLLANDVNLGTARARLLYEGGLEPKARVNGTLWMTPHADLADIASLSYFEDPKQRDPMFGDNLQLWGVASFGPPGNVLLRDKRMKLVGVVYNIKGRKTDVEFLEVL